MSPLKLVGAPGSPYTRKMRALMRYRRVPFHFILRNSRDEVDIPPVPVALIPILVIPGVGDAEAEALVDSTVQLRRLEELDDHRSVIPPDPALTFLDYLLEDYGDEWVTKMMFHYRWYYGPDVEKAGNILPLWGRVDVSDAEVAPLSKMIRERQVGRLGVVGSNETTAPVIEDSYRRLLALLDVHLQGLPFLFGRRPSAADFAIYGQLTQLVFFDPTPSAIAVAEAPRVYAWCERLEDLSGASAEHEDWISRDEMPQTLRALIGEVGRVYAPFLLANAAALEAGADQVEGTIDGKPWVQKPFPYQGKCLTWLRQRHADLGPDDRLWVDEVLAGTGCQALFAS